MRIQYKTGGQRTVRDSIGRRLIRVGIAREVAAEKSGAYLTRDMRAADDAQPVVESRPDSSEPGDRIAEIDNSIQPVSAAPLHADETSPAAYDEMDAMDVDQLRALAKERGVKVHHNAGAEKVRAALREAAQ